VLEAQANSSFCPALQAGRLLQNRRAGSTSPSGEAFRPRQQRPPRPHIGPLGSWPGSVHLCNSTQNNAVGLTMSVLSCEFLPLFHEYPALERRDSLPRSRRPPCSCISSRYFLAYDSVAQCRFSQPHRSREKEVQMGCRSAPHPQGFVV
jgi:hypothetical protein